MVQAFLHKIKSISAISFIARLEKSLEPMHWRLLNLATCQKSLQTIILCAGAEIHKSRTIIVDAAKLF